MLPEELPLTPEEIEKLIKATGYNQKEFAAQLGLAEATISKWVNGQGQPNRDNADKLRAVKPRPDHIRDWNTYVAEARARVVANRQPPAPSEPASPPPPALDPEAIGASAAANLRASVTEAIQAGSHEVAQAIQACAAGVKAVEISSSRLAEEVQTCAAKVDELKATVPTVEAVAEMLKATVPTIQDVAVTVADAVQAVVPKTPDVVDALKAVIPSAQENASAMKAVTPSAQDVAAEVKAPITALARTVKVSAALIVTVLLMGFGSIFALGCRATAATQRELANVSYIRALLGALLDMGKKNEELWIPKDPFPGQKLAKDCDLRLGEKAINGGCWVGLVDVKPPCGILFRHGDICYRPVSADPQKPVGVSPAPGQR